MALGYLSSLLILGVVLLPEATACPDPMELSGRVELCMEPLSDPTTRTVMGELRSTTWRPACRTYNESVRCVTELEQQCLMRSHELEVTRSTLNVLRTGFGQICDNKKTRDSYMKYAPCYQSHAGHTQQCLGQFSERVQAITTGNDMDMDSYDDNPMCGAFQEMVRCVNKAVEDCGSDAASILDGLMRAQVPQQITTMCQDSVAEPTPPPNNPEATGSASTIVPSFLLSATVFMFL